MLWLKPARLLFLIVALGSGLLAPGGKFQAIPDLPARLRVEVRDRHNGELVPSRIYLADETGAPKTPPGAISYDKGEEHHFVAPGSFEMDLPAGAYTLQAERGPEYFPASATLRVAAGRQRTETLQLKRWIDMNRLGWYSGDLHNHRKLADMPQLLAAEDLNLAATLTDWIWEDRSISRPPQTTEAVRRVDATHVYSVLDKEVERLESGPGAVGLLGLARPISFEGYRLHPPSSVYCKQAHAQKAYVDAEKILWRDVAALVALGHVDFAGLVHNHFNRHGVDLETERWGMIPKHRPEFDSIAGMPLWAMDVYYRWLNCGFRLPASAGSASGVKAAPLGYNRVYVKVAAPFSYSRWFASLKAGRSFATNGPMLFLAVNGQGPGATLTSAGNEPLKLKVRVEATSAGPLERLEVISRGSVIYRTTKPDASGNWIADFESSADQTGWLAARCFERAGRTIRFAHTSPVYIELRSRAPSASSDAQFFIDWIDREIEFYKKENGFRDPRHREEMLSLFRSARAVYLRKRRGL